MRVSTVIQATMLAAAAAALLPQRATGPHRSPSPASIATMAPQTPQVATSREADLRFADVVSRCESVFEDFEAFMKVPDLLRDVFDADFQHIVEHIRPAAASQNISCQRPVAAENLITGGVDISGDGLATVETEPGRVCCDDCGSECSRVVVPQFATDAECAELCRIAEAEMLPPPQEARPWWRRWGQRHEDDDSDECEIAATQLPLEDAAFSGDAQLVLLMIRLVERLRRAVAYEYGLPLASVAPHTAMVSRWVHKSGCGSGTPLHGDEAACDGFHYSSVLHLSTQGDGFEGGDFVFSDRATAAGVTAAATSPLAPDAISEIGRPSASNGKATDGRLLTRMKPLRGRATIFSSGWENLHFVDEITSGVRYAMPAFFVTHADWAREGPEDLRGEVSREDVASALLLHVLSPDQGGGDDGQLTALWHACFAAPLEEHEEE